LAAGCFSGAPASRPILRTAADLQWPAVPRTRLIDFGSRRPKEIVVGTFLQRLRERKLVQWALAYVAAAFALLQAFDIVGQQFGWPESVRRGITIALAIGFFITLVLAWYHGERGAQRMSGTELLLVALLLAIGGTLLWRFAPVAPGPETHVATSSLGENSTAVLPFVNMSGDKGNEYFSDGMTETLLDRLAQVPQLKVAARTSSFSFKGKAEDVRQIGLALGVATVVEGSVQQAGDTLRITAQLVRAIDGSHLWSKHFDRRAADLFAIQDEIAGAVTEALVGELLPNTRAILAQGGTKDVAAYDAYTRALHQIDVNSFESFQQALSLLQQALARDPNYVDAMLALVHTGYVMARTGQISGAEHRARAEPMLDRIEKIDPGNGRLLAFRGEIAQERGEHLRAVQLGERAVAAAPGDLRVHLILADILAFQDDLPASLKEMDQAVALSPLDNNIIRFRATRLFLMTRYDEARVETLRALQLAPQNSSNYWMLSLIAYLQGDLVEAIVSALKEMPLDASDPEGRADLAIFVDAIGEHAAADKWKAEANRLSPGGMLVAGADIWQRYARGDRAGAVAEAIAIVPRSAEEHHGYWGRSIVLGCLAADELGRSMEMRAALEASGALPRDLTAAGFDAWVGPSASPLVKLRELADIRRCAFNNSAGDASRREQLLAIFARVAGPDWEAQDEFRGIGAELRNDRAAMIAWYGANDAASTFALRTGRRQDLLMREGSARMLGIADDPAVARYFSQRHEQVAQMRAALPAALAKEGISLLPAVRQ
jgi:TolB-like protein/Tfp pilus assembly protein PilF